MKSSRLLTYCLAIICPCAFYLRTYDSISIKELALFAFGIPAFLAWYSEGGGVLNYRILPYFLIGIVSFILSDYKALGSMFLMQQGMIFAICLMVTGFNQLEIENLRKCFIATAIICIFYGIVQLMKADPFRWAGVYGARIFSAFGNPNFYADFLLFAFPIILCQHLKKRNELFVSLFVAGIACLFFTGAKSAWLAFIIEGIAFAGVYALFFTDIPKRSIYITTTALAIISILGLLQVYRMASNSRSSALIRSSIWRSTINMIADKPLLGWGPGSFRAVFPKYRETVLAHLHGVHNTETRNAENELIEITAETGIIGLIGFIFVLWGVCAKAIKRMARAQSLTDLWAFVGLIGMMAHNICDVSMRFLPSGLLFWLLIGVMLRQDD